MATWAILAAAAAAGLPLYSAVAQQKAVIAGTLTCTFANVPQSRTYEIDLSCNFASLDGSRSDYQGSARRLGTADFPAGKHVWLWNVVAPQSKDAPPLEGIFKGETGGATAGVLLGGPDNSVRLEAVTGTAQIAGPPTLTVLTLRLIAKKASIRRYAKANVPR